MCWIMCFFMTICRRDIFKNTYGQELQWLVVVNKPNKLLNWNFSRCWHPIKKSPLKSLIGRPLKECPEGLFNECQSLIYSEFQSRFTKVTTFIRSWKNCSYSYRVKKHVNTKESKEKSGAKLNKYHQLCNLLSKLAMY